MTHETECTKEIKRRATRLITIFDYEREDALQREVSAQNTRQFRNLVQILLDNANELLFITKEDASEYAKEIMKLTQRIFAEGNSVIADERSNRDMKDVVHKKCKDIIDYIFMIENNESFKSFVYEGDVDFDESKFIEVARNITLIKRNSSENENSIKYFQEELNGGYVLSEISKSIDANVEEEPVLYGVDLDVNVGVKSRDRGIKTARGGLLSVSNYWADLTVSTNKFITFSRPRDSRGIKAIRRPFAYEQTLNRNISYDGGILIYNAPYYRMPLIKKDIGSMDVLAVLNADDEYGNLIFVVRKRYIKSNKVETLLRQAQFAPQTLPKTLDKKLTIEITPKKAPSIYRARFVDMDDISLEFVGTDPSSKFIFDKYEVESNSFTAGRALQETKDGHIPTLATGGYVSGRYADEVLEEVVGKKSGFDNLIETKIIKREIEEKERVMHNGEMVTEISEKKSNVIVSTALTADGEFIELFSNETE